MNLFNQLIPRLSRQPAASCDSTACEPEFTVKPAYEIKEADDAWSLTVHLPGVAKSGLDLTAEEGRLTITGRRAWQRPANWASLYRESVDAPFSLTLEHDHSVNVEKIHADLKDGVLHISLPKTDAIKPRKIAVS